VNPAWLALKAPWQWARQPDARWARALLPAVLALGLLGALASGVSGTLPPRVATIVALLLAGTGLLALWGQQFAALLRLDHPHAARLVPGHGTALRRAAVALWLVLVAVCAVVAAVVASAMATPVAVLAQAVQLTALGAGGAMLYVAAALRWWWLWVLAWLLPLPPHVPLLADVVRAAWDALRGPWIAAPWLATALGLAALGVALVSIFGRGDAAHARGYAARERMRRAFEASSAGQAPGAEAYGPWAERLGRPWRRLADAWLARTTDRARPGTAGVLARADIVLLGPQHWLRQVAVMLPLLAMLLLVGGAAILWGGVPPRDLLRHAAFGSGIGLTCMLVGMATGWSGALWTSRREQALLMLLPGMPQGVALNRALAGRHARAFALMVVALLPFFLATAWASDSWHPLAMPAVALTLVAWLWRDASRLRGPTPAGAALPYFVCLLLGGGSAALLREQPGWTLPWLLAWAAITVTLLAWRWSRLARWPQALPAGRLA
jgi:hypothetical protein